MVGSSGAMVERCELDTPSGRSLPDLTSGTLDSKFMK